jgi:hypothetical protein
MQKMRQALAMLMSTTTSQAFKHAATYSVLVELGTSFSLPIW